MSHVSKQATGTQTEQQQHSSSSWRVPLGTTLLFSGFLAAAVSKRYGSGSLHYVLTALQVDSETCLRFLQDDRVRKPPTY